MTAYLISSGRYVIPSGRYFIPSGARDLAREGFEHG
jgi:hypothetical protein